MSKNYVWRALEAVTSKVYRCGHCGEKVASERGYSAMAIEDGIQIGSASQYYCHTCGLLTFFDADGKQIPGAKFGEDVRHISDSHVNSLYDEARLCCAANAFTGAVLCCRKLLMNIAVSKGATEGLRFIEYVEYLEAKNYTPPGSEDWVNHIRKKGNEATHEIQIMNKDDAEELIEFLEILLKFIYEFPERTKKRTQDKTTSPIMMPSKP